MAVYLSRKLAFSAMHMYRVEAWSDQQNKNTFGPCSNPNGHGHDYVLKVMAKGNVKPDSGIVVNITDIDRKVKRFVEDKLNGKFLNKENVFFQQELPTTENIVRYIWDNLESNLDECELHEIRLHETDYLYAEKGADDMVRLTKRYHFSTAHRLHSDQLSLEENERLFGKCNNPYGHGHNYYMEVTVKGKPDPVTGMVVNLADMDQAVEREVMERFDHKHLNLDTEEFKALNPTSENVIMVIWSLLSPHLPALYKIGLYETEKNYFEYYGPGEEQLL